MRARVAATLSLAALLACSDEPPAPRQLDLGGEVVARVGDLAISSATIQRVVAAQGVTAQEARERAVRDALFAAEALDRGLGEAWAPAPVAARALFEELRREESRPVTDEELERVTERRWLSLRRPASRRLVHAIVRVPAEQQGDEGFWSAAEAVGAEIRDTVEEAVLLAVAQPHASGDDPAMLAFRERATEVDAAGFKVKVEELGSIAEDGRIVSERGGLLVAEFMKGCSKLQKRGDLAGPFRTAFGVHVVLQTKSAPAIDLPAEERRERVRSEVIDDRLRTRRQALLRVGRESVEVPPNAPALLDLVRVQ